MSERVSNRVFDTVNIILLALLFLFAWHPFPYYRHLLQLKSCGNVR